MMIDLRPILLLLTFLTSLEAFAPLTRKIPRCSSLATTRRDMLLTTATGSLWVAKQGSTEPVADLPMIRLKLPRGGLGREYVAIRLKVDGQGPYEFMVDSGLTTELITPHLQQSLRITSGGEKMSGIGAGGGKLQDLVELKQTTLCCGKGDQEIDIPNLHALITDFPQEHIDPAHDPVEGMIGMELLSMFDVDFDFPNGRLRFWKPGTVASEALAAGLVEVPAVVINETGLIGIRLAAPGAKQPILAFLDCGASFSAINWAAAPYLGLPPKDDPSYRKAPSVAAIGVDGRPLQLPTAKKELTFLGEITRDAAGKPTGFASPPLQWTNWKPVQLAVGDLPAFANLLGDGVTPYRGPGALLGLDVLSQRRVILEAARDDTRRRRVFISPQ